MPPKKQTNSSTMKQTKSVKKTTTEETMASATQSTSSEQQSPPVVNNVDNNEKLLRRAGRTLLVKSVSGNHLDGSVFDKFTGLVDKSETKTTNSFFLTFDSVENSLKAYNQLHSEQSLYKVKFSYYRVFFTMDGLTDSTDYNQVKQELTNYVSNNTNSSVLYCKFYRKNNKYLGCGDFTIDTLTGMSLLLSKEGTLKEYSFGSYKGTFYRFNGKKETHSAVNNA